MCSRYSVISSNLRDTFSAGGKVGEIGGVKFEHKVPQVLNTLYQYRELIKTLLKQPDEALIQDVEDYWDENESNSICLYNWFELIQQTFSNNIEFSGINIHKLFDLWK